MGAQIQAAVLKGGDNKWRTIKITQPALPRVIFEDYFWNDNGKTYYDETMVIFETNTSYTTKVLGGCLPYWKLAQLFNDGNVFTCVDPQTGVENDIYIPHVTYQKKTGNFHLEMSTMHRNPNSDVWQATMLNHSIFKP